MFQCLSLFKQIKCSSDDNNHISIREELESYLIDDEYDNQELCFYKLDGSIVYGSIKEIVGDDIRINCTIENGDISQDIVHQCEISSIYLIE